MMLVPVPTLEDRPFTFTTIPLTRGPARMLMTAAGALVPAAVTGGRVITGSVVMFTGFCVTTVPPPLDVVLPPLLDFVAVPVLELVHPLEALVPPVVGFAGLLELDVPPEAVEVVAVLVGVPVFVVPTVLGDFPYR